MLIFFPRCPVSNPMLQHQSDKKTKQKKTILDDDQAEEEAAT